MQTLKLFVTKMDFFLIYNLKQVIFVFLLFVIDGLKEIKYYLIEIIILEFQDTKKIFYNKIFLFYLKIRFKLLINFNIKLKIETIKRFI